MGLEKFDQFSDEELRRIVSGESKGYSAKEIDVVRRVLEERSKSTPAHYCRQCGTQMAEGQSVCHICGLHLYGDPEPRPAKATGGLRVWLWIIIVADIIVACLLLIEAIAAIRLGPIIVSTTLAGLVLVLITIFGEFRLLKGFKKGFYIICACVSINFFINIFVLGFSVLPFIGLLSPVIIWMFAKGQWKNFR